MKTNGVKYRGAGQTWERQKAVVSSSRSKTAAQQGFPLRNWIVVDYRAERSGLHACNRRSISFPLSSLRTNTSWTLFFFFSFSLFLFLDSPCAPLAKKKGTGKGDPQDPLLDASTYLPCVCPGWARRQNHPSESHRTVRKRVPECFRQDEELSCFQIHVGQTLLLALA